MLLYSRYVNRPQRPARANDGWVKSMQNLEDISHGNLHDAEINGFWCNYDRKSITS